MTQKNEEKLSKIGSHLDSVAGMFTENEEDQGYMKKVLNLLSAFLLGTPSNV